MLLNGLWLEVGCPTKKYPVDHLLMRGQVTKDIRYIFTYTRSIATNLHSRVISCNKEQPPANWRDSLII